MKKLFLSLSFLISLILASLNAQTVYTTKTGEKYHRSDCQYLSKSKYATDLKDAIAAGYEPCKVCKPPQTATVSKNDNEYQATNPKVDNNAVSAQCSATTKAGKRCKRMTKSSNGLCWQHGG